METVALRSLAHRREERTRHGMLTRVARPFGAPSSGFPGENLFEPNAEAAGRTSASNPFKYVLRCCGPQRAGDLVLRAEVERSSARSGFGFARGVAKTEVRKASASKGKGKHFWVGDADPSY